MSAIDATKSRRTQISCLQWVLNQLQLDTESVIHIYNSLLNRAKLCSELFVSIAT